MGLSKVTFNVGRDGLGRRAPNEDKVSGLMFFNDTPPTGWATDNVQLVYTLDEAEQKGLMEGSVGHEVDWYHVSEFFRANPEGELYIGYYAVPAGAYTFTEIPTMQNTADGRIRQLGIFANKTFDSADTTLIQAQIDIADAAGGRLVVLLAEDFTAVTDLTTTDDLRALSALKVSVVIGEDYGGAGNALHVSKGYSVTALGNCLGMLSLSMVQQSIGWPALFNVSNGVELEVPGVCNGSSGTAIKDISAALLGALKDKGYTVLRKYTPHITGSYWERQPTAVALTDDFAWMEYNRTMDKAIRSVESVLVPELNRDLLLTSEGKLSSDVIGYFDDLCQGQLDLMEADGEISASDVLIDPDQNVLATSTLYITIKIVPVGIAEFIEVNIGFTVSL